MRVRIGLRPAIVIAALTALFGWSYWATLERLVATWMDEADYSHGFFVVPVALCFLWAKRDRFPGVAGGLHWAGLLLVAVSIAMRLAGAQYYLEALDGWSILVWVAGVVWLFCGPRVLWWSLPAVLFLWFMVRLPWSVERELSYPLQTIATNASCWVLQLLGQPALREGPTGHTIVLGNHLLEVEQACSGLRIFVGIAALAYAYVVLVRRAWWEKGLLLLSALPIAIIANATRVVVTGLLFQYCAQGETAKRFSHDAAGWVMIPFAAALFALVLWYLDRVWQEVEVVEVGSIVRRARGDLGGESGG
jgi:exosortase